MSGHPPSPGAERPRQRRKRFLTRRKILVATLVVVAVVFALHSLEINWSAFPDLLGRVNRPLALLLMAILPVFGFSVLAVYLAAGAIFGPWVGGLVVAGLTFVHLFITHLLALTVFRGRVERWRQKWLHRLPIVAEGHEKSLVAMIVIVPALPYVARNCLLALSGVKLRYMVLVALPLYVARSYVAIFLGDLGNGATSKQVEILVAVLAVKLTISALLFRHLRHTSRPHTAHPARA